MSFISNSKKRAAIQHTIGAAVIFRGKGVHSNLPVSMALHPSPANTGVFFVKTNADGSETEIPARYEAVGSTELCTIVGDPRGAFVATIEHLMAALSALHVDNVRIEIDGAEVPVMDGSAHDFVSGILEVGLMAQAARRQYIRIEKPIRVDHGPAFGELTPYDGCFFDVEIDFDDPTIGRQRFATDLSAEAFIREVSRARTFGFMKDVEKLWQAGYARGSSLENSVVIGDEGIVNPDGLRFPDEFVRHKLLDAIGDLALGGAPILGAYRSYRGGHKLNFMMLKALFENRSAWSFVEPTSAGAASKGHGKISNAAIALAPATS